MFVACISWDLVRAEIIVKQTFVRWALRSLTSIEIFPSCIVISLAFERIDFTSVMLTGVLTVVRASPLEVIGQEGGQEGD